MALAAALGMLATAPYAAARVAPDPLAPMRPPAEALPALPPPGSPADPSLVAAALRGSLGVSGPAGVPAVLVVDATTGQILADQRSPAVLAPASTTKLLTAAAVLTSLGPDVRLATRLVRAGSTLYVVGGGDPTLSRTGGAPAYPRQALLGDLARQARDARLSGVRTVLADGSLFAGPSTAPGWTASELGGGSADPVSAVEVDEGRSGPGVIPAPRDGSTGTSLAQAMAAALSAVGMHVAAAGVGTAPPGAATVATVASERTGALVERMLSYSDSDLAESLGRLAARRSGQPPTFAGATGAILARVADLGIPLDGVSLHDSSGLSLLDRIPPATEVAILRLAVRDPRLRPILAALPVAGFSGTLASRYHDAGTALGAGVVRAKTGRVLGSTALAGEVVDASGRLLVFALQVPAPDDTEGARVADSVAVALARCRC